jgi:hypothetical protein
MKTTVLAKLATTKGPAKISSTITGAIATTAGAALTAKYVAAALR